MPDWEARARVAERENEEMRERIASLEETLGFTFDAPAFLRLSVCEAKLFGALLARPAVTKQLAMEVLYGGKPDADVAMEKIVDVFVCKLRRKLKPFGLRIETNWGQGYFMAPDVKAAARKLIEESEAA